MIPQPKSKSWHRSAPFWLLLVLCVPLFIYLFYRTDRTVITHLTGQLLGAETFRSLRFTITKNLPLPHFVVYSLPELIWVFVATRLAGNLYFKVGSKAIGCIWIPLLFSFGLEIAQGLHWAHGRFDWWDCGAIWAGWLAGRHFHSASFTMPQRLLPLNLKSGAFLLCFSSVLLAHVY